jgi:hypothetical protein
VADWHLQELERQLGRRGWEIREVRRSENDMWGRSGSWELVRGDQRLWLDFTGGDADGVITHPIEHAYGCDLRGRAGIGVYFARKKSTAAWRAELDAFVTALDAVTRA